MATQVNEPIPLTDADSIEMEIIQTINSLIQQLNQRRCQLLEILKDRRKIMRSPEVEPQLVRQQLEDTCSQLQSQMTHNKLHTLQARISAEMEAKRKALEGDLPPSQELRFECDISH